MVTDNKQSDSRKLADQIKDALAGIDSGNELPSDGASKIFDELTSQDSFNQEVEQILACLNEHTMDLKKLQTQTIILIKKYLSKLPNKQLATKIDEKIINENIAEVSGYLMQQHSQLVKDANKNLLRSKDKLSNITSKSRNDLKKLIKNFAIYQIYKFMNPKRIAGETKKENFAHNMIKGGMELASHYEGGSKSDIKSYSKEFIKKLEVAHKNFKVGRGIY